MRQNTCGIYPIKLMLLLFWACWFLLACTTNIIDFIAAYYHTPSTWHFRSGNYQTLAKVVAIYKLPTPALNTLFLLDILVQAR